MAVTRDLARRSRIAVHLDTTSGAGSGTADSHPCLNLMSPIFTSDKRSHSDGVCAPGRGLGRLASA